MKAAASGMEVYVSITIVTMCRARKTRTSRDRLRCRPTVTNRGHLSPANRPAVSTPSRTLQVSSSMVTRPAARVAYQRPGPWRETLTGERIVAGAASGHPPAVTVVPS